MASKLIGDGRPKRFCPLCEQTDDHPRHVKTSDPADKVAEHMDCCRARGCPDGSCDVIGEVVGDGVRGADLLAGLQDKSDQLAEKVAERVGLFTDPRSSAEILADPQADRVALSPDQSGSE